MIGTGQLGEQPTQDATVLPASSRAGTEVEGGQGNRQQTSGSRRNEAINWVACLVLLVSVLSF